MNCKPNDLAIVKSEQCTILANLVDHIVKVTRLDRNACGDAAWEFEGPRRFIFGELFAVIPDRLLRPIRDPGDDARDETLDWLPVPKKEEVKKYVFQEFK